MRYVGAVSTNTIYRLPKYLRCLQELEESGFDRISSSAIAQRLGLTPSQVRQDLSRFGNYGAQGYGYDIKRLANGIREILGINRTHSVIMIGVGSIGRALLTHLDFGHSHYEVIGSFDNNPEIVGKTIQGVPIYSIDSLEAFLDENYVDICILAVPKKDARAIATLAAEHGVGAIWNYTNVDLDLSSYPVVVENVHFLDSLYALTFHLEETHRKREMNYACVNK